MEMTMTALCQVMPIHWLEAISQIKYRQARYSQAWSLLGLLLTPVAVTAGALAAWRFGVDTGWTGRFFIASGFLCHWQVWCAFAISAEGCAYILKRESAARESRVPALAPTRPLG
jgi:hypothetical protein